MTALNYFNYLLLFGPLLSVCVCVCVCSCRRRRWWKKKKSGAVVVCVYLFSIHVHVVRWVVSSKTHTENPGVPEALSISIYLSISFCPFVSIFTCAHTQGQWPCLSHISEVWANNNNNNSTRRARDKYNEFNNYIKEKKINYPPTGYHPWIPSHNWYSITVYIFRHIVKKINVQHSSKIYHL
jgi:hypothetical protein